MMGVLGSEDGVEALIVDTTSKKGEGL